MNKPTVLAMVAGLLLGAGCGEWTPDPGELPKHRPGAHKPTLGAEVPPAARAEADEVFATRCTPCHGPEGWGNGPAAASLPQHPRNFHDRAWQSSVDDHHIETIIQQGGPSVGKSELMPSNPDLVEKHAVVEGLRAKVRAFGRM